MTRTATGAGSGRRRTQAERSAKTRRRLIEATLECLRRFGFSGTTISRIVASAGVSRGAHVHHYPSKNQLIDDAARELMRRAFARLAEASEAVTDSAERLSAFTHCAWEAVFSAPEMEAFLELSVAARSDPALAKTLHPLAQEYVGALADLGDYYFESVDPDVQVRDVIMLCQWTLRGMALDLHIPDDDEYLDRYVNLWVDVMRTKLKPRRFLDGPPPKVAAFRPHDR